MAILVRTTPLPSAPFVEALRRAAPHIPVWTDEDAPDASAVEAILAWRMQEGVLPRFPNLRVVCSTAAGVDKLIVADWPAHVPITRVVDPAQALQMAQFVVGQTLSFTRDLRMYAEQQKQALWKRHRVRGPDRCRVGILGLGHVGRAIAAAFNALGYPVSAWTRSAQPATHVTPFVGLLERPAFLAQADILICALPLTPDTRGLLNRETLSQLPRGAFVVSVGRGEHVVEPDLRALLDEGHLGGAALDVFEREPPKPDNWVWHHPLVVATPHISGEASFDVVARQCIDSLEAARRGEKPAHAVDRHAGY